GGRRGAGGAARHAATRRPTRLRDRGLHVGQAVRPAGARARRWHAACRHLGFLALVLATVAFLTSLLLAMTRTNGTTPLEAVVLVLSVLLLVPITLSFWIAVAGFVVEWRGRDPLGLEGAAGDGGDGLEPATAIVAPVCNENLDRVLAGLGA